jgi:4-amino-4-deoxy-L-arabinose transferase-like glycosyltransferase
MILPRLNVNWKLCYHAIKKFYKQKCELGPNKFMKCKPFREDLPGFSAHADTEHVKLLFCILWQAVTVALSPYLLPSLFFRPSHAYRFNISLYLGFNLISLPARIFHFNSSHFPEYFE